jgi:hypothetical protein
MIEETNTFKQACAAILYTQGTDRVITHILDVTQSLHYSYPRGTRYFLIRSESPTHSEQFDSVYWRNGCCIIVSERDLWRVTRAQIISSLLEPMNLV